MSKLVPIIFLVASGLLFFFVIDPMYNGKPEADIKGVKEIQLEKAAYDNVLLRARELQAKRDELMKRYNSISQVDKTRLEQLLPDTLDNVRLVLDIDRIAAQNAIKIKNISVNDGNTTEKKSVAPDERAYGTANITFSVTATYDQFLNFLNDLEDGLRLIDITALTISNKSVIAYDYTVTFKTYWLKK